MSTDYNTYVGPFVTVHNPPKQSKKEYYGCNNDTCRKYQKECSSKFCPECGRAIVLVSVPSTEKLYIDLYKECKDSLIRVYTYSDSQKDYDVYIPNSRELGKHLSHRDEGGFHSYNETVVADETSRFMGTLSKDLEKICKVFGANNVAYHWGVIQYTS